MVVWLWFDVLLSVATAGIKTYWHAAVRGRGGGGIAPAREVVDAETGESSGQSGRNSIDVVIVVLGVEVVRVGCITVGVVIVVIVVVVVRPAVKRL